MQTLPYALSHYDLFPTKWKSALIVEDDIFLLPLLEDALKEVAASIKIHFAATGEKARDLIDQQTENGNFYDLVFADVYLDGEITGIDIWEKCREERLPTTVLLSSSLDLRRLAKMLPAKLRSLNYLRKPFLFSDCCEMFLKLSISSFEPA